MVAISTRLPLNLKKEGKRKDQVQDNTTQEIEKSVRLFQITHGLGCGNYAAHEVKSML